MPQITLDLSLEQTNMVLEALGQLPYVRVYELIETIGRQAGAQVQAPSVEAEQARLTPVRSA
ncbi:hypothetical protein [Verrucosispora sp. NA02020]|uniref:hypothetical protein n=1 Tax=Verrucosispora sp. NA02020 TaxID=2742132 RepID=UPI00159177FF|nr:hypothetical protein [Verrucosispora sp. NA02020]QKW13693.1 hypothetical protein HUT12_13485 [Verrucosispora sp. NA02020]